MPIKFLVKVQISNFLGCDTISFSIEFFLCGMQSWTFKRSSTQIPPFCRTSGNFYLLGNFRGRWCVNWYWALVIQRETWESGEGTGNWRNVDKAKQLKVLLAITKLFNSCWNPAVACKPYLPPFNGALSCSYSDIWGGELCNPQCSSKFEFSRTPAQQYYCLTDGSWFVYDWSVTVDKSMPWPDCSGKFHWYSQTIHS